MGNRLRIAASALLIAAQCGGNAWGADKAPETGKLLASELCARCHAIGVSGDSPFAPAPPFRTLASKYNLTDLEEALAEGISVGHEAMPEFAFSPEQIDAFIAYLRSLH
jgi:cytochrome c